ncbi:MAG: DNA polymerase I [Clostridia bacterium]|jgi:DNA polymerase-1|nr:DNA polymerase I [Clostridia bacterium]MBR0438883.1 DNA polymerase I [Clostridia bacterium]
MKKRKLILIDGNSLLFRAFYALPLMTDQDGKPVNAIFGFYSMFCNILFDHKPDLLGVAFDMAAPTFRKQMYDDYKGTRKKTPPELLEQIDVLKDSLHGLGVRTIEKEGYEADDIIGTFAGMAEKEGDTETLIYTGDRDSLQLITDTTRVMMTRKGVTEIEVFDKTHLNEVYGLEPLQIIDLKGLMGDSSDNIPGIAGVGEKTALKLLSQFRTVEGVYEHLDDLPANKLKEKVIGGREMAFFSKKLATIMTEVPLSETLEDLAFSLPDRETMLAAFSHFGFRSLIKRFELDRKEKKETPDSVPIGDIDAMDEFISGIDGDIGIYKNGNMLYLSSGTDNRQIDLDNATEEVINGLRSVLSDTETYKTVYNLKELLHFLREEESISEGNVFDVMLAEYVLNPTFRNFSYEGIAERYDEEPSPQALFTIRRVQEESIRNRELEFIYSSVEMPLCRVLYGMERDGFRIDMQLLDRFRSEYREKIAELQQQIYDVSGMEFNISSPKQLGTVLFEKLGLPVVKKKKTGYSTDAEVLEKLRDMHPVIDLISEYRLMTKLSGTYIDGLENVVDKETGKVHTTFSQTATATGRISSIEPNLQNIPVRSEFTSKLRGLFIPSTEDGSIVAADYSQIELRVLAHISHDEHMIDAFRNDEDIHLRTASEIFQVPKEEVTHEMRSSAKAVNFGIVYGISSFGLATQLGIPRYKAEEYIQKYLSEFRGVSAYMRDIVAKARAEGSIRTMFGRIRYVPEITASNFQTRSFGERVALNTPIQGTAADIIKLAMIKVAQRIEAEGLRSRLISQVHDELIVDTVRGEEKAVENILKETMESVVRLDVPLKANVACGKTWGEAKA